MRNACIPVWLLAAYTCAAPARAKLPIAAGQPQDSVVTVCLMTNPDRTVMDAAATLASRMFAAIGVKLEWYEPRGCPAEKPAPVFVVIAVRTPKSYLPGSLGEALPQEGRHVWVFYDRVCRATPKGSATPLLAHVLVHEIAHVLQGVSRHSESGILKARWSEREIAQMTELPLSFTPADILLIHRGMEERRMRAASNALAAAGTP